MLRRMMRFPEVVEISGYSRPRIYQLMAEGKFPQAIKLSKGGKIVGWPEDTIVEWQESLIADRR